MPYSDVDERPTTFYRVHHKHAATTYNHSEGFRSGMACSNPRGLLGNTRRLADALGTHLNRISEPTPFISMTDDPDEALERARWYINLGKRRVRIYEINTEGQGMVYRHARGLAKKVLSRLRYRCVERDNWEYTENEWLCVDNIPQSAIVEVMTVDEFEGL